MEREDFRCISALLILVNLIGKASNPAETAVFWADELIKELEKIPQSNK